MIFRLIDGLVEPGSGSPAAVEWQAIGVASKAQIKRSVEFVSRAIDARMKKAKRANPNLDMTIIVTPLNSGPSDSGAEYRVPHEMYVLVEHKFKPMCETSLAKSK